MGEDGIGCSRNGILNKNENGCCKNFEDEIYWSNFKSMRFFLSLSSDFLSQLMIPKKFSENMRNKLPQMVVLKSPGDGAWEVQLLRDKNNLFFGDGWKEFAKAHNFKENDFLLFKYSRESCFKVWVFNEKDSCEKASSYFVRKSALGRSDAGESSQLNRKKTRENSEHEGPDTEEAPAGASMRKTRRQSVCSLRKSNAEAKTPSTPHTPDKELPNEANNERALQMASRYKTDESFTVVMKATNVSQYYRLGIPSPWARIYLERKNQDMELRRNGNKWRVRFNVAHRVGGGVLVSGWFNFVVDNELQESDVCLFKLVSRKDEPAIFHVRIFRADQPSHKPSSV